MWLSKRRASTIAVVLLSVVATAVVLPDVGSAGAAVTNYTDATVSGPTSIATGPDGNLYFTNSGNGSIGSIAISNHAITNFTDPGVSQPTSIAAGLDGHMWFTSQANSAIGDITTDGAGTIVVTTDPSISNPTGIAAGPDGEMWFTNAGNGSIGRITTDGTHTVSNFTHPSISFPTAITAGPDGAMWFTNAGSGSIGRITTTGAVTNFTNPSISYPSSIAAGPDGALWFTNMGSGTIGRITTGGAVTKFTDSSISAPRGIAAGPDGALWFTNAGNRTIGRITTAGVVTSYSGASISAPHGITLGPDNALWFTNAGNNSLGRLTVPVPNAPTGAGAVPFGDGGALVVWQTPASNGAPITGYVVRPYLGTVAQPAQVFNSTQAHQALTGLQDGKSYQFTVAAQNAGGTGPTSAKTAPIIVGSPSPPAKPTVTRVAAGSLKVAFKPPVSNGAPITKYTAGCASSNGGAGGLKSGAASPITVTGLTAGKTYNCRVSATNSRGTGPPSAPSAAINA